MTNSDRLQEIRERVEKATPGPWTVKDLGRWDFAMQPKEGQKGESVDIQRNARAWLIQVAHLDQWSMIFVDEAPDTEFIAASREDIPYLLQLVTEQQREIDRLREALQWIANFADPDFGGHVPHQNYGNECGTDKCEICHIEGTAKAALEETAFDRFLTAAYSEGIKEPEYEADSAPPVEVPEELRQRVLDAAVREAEVKGYRKQERPM